VDGQEEEEEKEEDGKVESGKAEDILCDWEARPTTTARGNALDSP
jgi:hypothetical protein